MAIVLSSIIAIGVAVGFFRSGICTLDSLFSSDNTVVDHIIDFVVIFFISIVAMFAGWLSFLLCHVAINKMLQETIKIIGG